MSWCQELIVSPLIAADLHLFSGDGAPLLCLCIVQHTVSARTPQLMYGWGETWCLLTSSLPGHRYAMCTCMCPFHVIRADYFRSSHVSRQAVSTAPHCRRRCCCCRDHMSLGFQLSLSSGWRKKKKEEVLLLPADLWACTMQIIARSDQQKSPIPQSVIPTILSQGHCYVTCF